MQIRNNQGELTAEINPGLTQNGDRIVTNTLYYRGDPVTQNITIRDMLIPALRELAAITGCQLVEPTPGPKVKLEPTVGKVQAPKEAKPGSRKRRKRDKDTSTPRALKPASCSLTASPPARRPGPRRGFTTSAPTSTSP